MIEEYLYENIDGRVLSVGNDKHEVHFDCPFCGDTRMRMYVNLDNGKYCCHNCRSYGKNFYEFMSLFEGIPITDIEDVYGRIEHVETEKIGDSIRRKLFNLQSNNLPNKTLMKLPDGFYQLAGDDGRVAQQVKAYLYSRGVTNENIRVHGWGYCVDGYYANRAILTIYNKKSVEFYVARAINPIQKPKELSPSNAETEIGKTDVIFNLDRAVKHKLIVISEGIFDALAWGDIGVALLGKRCSNVQFNTLLSFREELTDGVIVALDGDAKTEARELTEKLFSAGFNVYILLLKDGDPNDLLIKYGKKYCRELLNTAVKYDRLSAVKSRLM